MSDHSGTVTKQKVLNLEDLQGNTK
jgi:hypothetical protein